ncbi:MAG: integrin alpha, partial [Actinobacteria bacterium]|nr:integrin alpha [Actinomycetota bacterium]
MTRALAVSFVLVATALHAGSGPEAWKTYRSESFGWELSYPPEMELKAYFGGQSAELRDAGTGTALAELEIWPPDLCPRERPGTTAEAIGTERVAMVTQADGDDGSSSCGAPMTVRPLASRHDVPLYEVGLTCRSERIVGHRTIRRREGRKGYFGHAVAGLGDVDGDGVNDLAVSAPWYPEREVPNDGVWWRGQVWILLLNV